MLRVVWKRSWVVFLLSFVGLTWICLICLLVYERLFTISSKNQKIHCINIIAWLLTDVVVTVPMLIPTFVVIVVIIIIVIQHSHVNKYYIINAKIKLWTLSMWHIMSLMRCIISLNNIKWKMYTQNLMWTKMQMHREHILSNSDGVLKCALCIHTHSTIFCSPHEILMQCLISIIQGTCVYELLKTFFRCETHPLSLNTHLAGFGLWMFVWAHANISNYI